MKKQRPYSSFNYLSGNSLLDCSMAYLGSFSKWCVQWTQGYGKMGISSSAIANLSSIETNCESLFLSKWLCKSSSRQSSLSRYSTGPLASTLSIGQFPSLCRKRKVATESTISWPYTMTSHCRGKLINNVAILVFMYTKPLYVQKDYLDTGRQ